jgi:hypothetical protein
LVKNHKEIMGAFGKIVESRPYDNFIAGQHRIAQKTMDALADVEKQAAPIFVIVPLTFIS